MSGYSVYVWVGPEPLSDGEAQATSQRMWDAHGDASEPPSPILVAYVADLTQRHAGITGPADIMGPFLFMDIPFERMEEAYPDIVKSRGSTWPGTVSTLGWRPSCATRSADP